MTTARRMLLRAANSVDAEPHRWGQGSMWFALDGERHACMLGLVCSGGSFDSNPGLHPLLDSVDGAIDALRESAGTDIPEWNDQPGQTPGEVSAMLRSAAERLAQDHTQGGTP